MTPNRQLPVGALLAMATLALLGAWLMAHVARLEVQTNAEARLAKAERDRTRAQSPKLTAAQRSALLAKAQQRTEAASHGRREAEALRAHTPFTVLGLAPLLLGVLASFHRPTVLALRAWRPERVAWLAAGLSAWFLVLTADGYLSAARFDAYVPAILAAVAAAAVLAPRSGLTQGRLCGIGLAVWLLLWIPFDLRWYDSIWLGTSGALAYPSFAFLVVVLGVLAFAVSGRLDDLGLHPPRRGDLVPVGIFLALLALVVLPIGLASGFLELTAPKIGLGQALLAFLGIALTVALPEELFFRGILDAGLQKHFRSRWVSLGVSSFAFGLMHWNNRGDLGEKLLYVLLATIAGVFYGLAFRKSKGLVAPILLHTLVDVAWVAFLGG